MMKFIIATIAGLLVFCSTANASTWGTPLAGTASYVTNNQAPGAPATITAGQYIFIITAVQASGTARTLSTPAGYTLLLDELPANTAINAKFYCKVAAGGDAMPTLNWSGGADVFMVAIAVSGGNAQDCSTVLHNSNNGSNSSTSVWPTQSLTITTANTLVLSLSQKIAGEDGTGSNYGTLTCPTETNGSNPANHINTGSFKVQTMVCSIVQTTATTLTGANITVSGTQEADAVGRGAVSLLIQDAATFSVAPAQGTRTTSTIPITATTACTDCSANPAGFYGVAYADGGSTPTCTQIIAGQDSSGSAAYKAFGPIAMTATVQNTGTFSTYTDGTKRDSAYCLKSTSLGNSAVSTLADIDKIPVAACAFNSSTSGGATYDCTLDGAGTVYGVACIKDSTSATVTQAEAAHCTGDVAAKASANRSGTGSLTVGTTLPNPVYDFSFVGIYNFGSQHEAATHQDFDRCLSAATGKQVINCPNGLTSIGSGSAVESLNALITPDWAVGDIPVCDTYTHTAPAGTQQFVAHMSVAGFVSYDAGDGSRTYLNCDAYDLSVGAMATVADANNDLDWWDQDPPIQCQAPFDEVLKTNVAMNVAPNPGNLDFTTLCVHPLGDAITALKTSGTWPTGLTLTASVLSGTATVEDEVGAAITVTATSNVTGGTGTQDLTVYPVTTFTIADYVGSSVSDAQTGINPQTHGSVNLIFTAVCPSSSAVGTILTQTPAAGEVAPYDTITFTVAGAQSGGDSTFGNIVVGPTTTIITGPVLTGAAGGTCSFN